MNTNKQKVLDIDGTKLTINKLPMRKLAGLMDMLKEIPEDVKNMITQDFDKMSNDEFIAKLPTVIATMMPQLAEFVARACNSEDAEATMFLDEFGFDDNLLVIETILEVNRMQSILERIKKIKALYQGKALVPVQNT